MSQAERYTSEKVANIYQMAWQKEWDSDHAGARALWVDLLGHESLAENKALLLCDIGLTQRLENDYKAAEASFKKALKLAEKASRPEIQVEALAGLMDTYRTYDRDKSGNAQKRLADAETCKQTALSLFSTIPESANLAKINYEINIALLRWESDDNQNALKDIKIAEAMCDLLLEYQPGNRIIKNRQARVFTVKGVTLEKLGKLDAALTAQAQSFAVCRDLNDVRGMGNAAMSAGGIYERQGNVDKARVWYKMALKASMSGDEILDRTIYASAQEKLASLSSRTTASL